MIPYGRQLVEDDDIDAVTAVLHGAWLTCGPAIDELEESLRVHTGAAHAIAFANGTAALHAALSVAGIGPGDRVLTSPRSFVASANCAQFVGASADFVDIVVYGLLLLILMVRLAGLLGAAALGKGKL